MSEGVEKIRKMERSPKGMVDAMFDAIDDMVAKEMTAEEVRAISHTCKTVVNVARLEADIRKMKAEFLGKQDLKSLPIS